MSRRLVFSSLILSAALAAPCIAEAAVITLPSSTFVAAYYPTYPSPGTSFSYAGTVTSADTLSFTVSGLACLQAGGANCTNAAGVVAVAGADAVGTSSVDPLGGLTYGSLRLTISGVGTEQLFLPTTANGLGGPVPTSLTALTAPLSSFGFGPFSVSNPTLTFTVDDLLYDDDSGGFTITPIPEPASLALCGLALIGLVGLRRGGRA